MVTDFAMNSICGGGTGSYLDSLAIRLGIKIEDFGDIALKSKEKVNIPGRCCVFSTTDSIHKINIGYKVEDVLMGVCNGLVRNYLAMLVRGKKIAPPYSFQGGTSKNSALVRCMEEQIDHKVIIPPNAGCMGAIGMAIITRNNGTKTKFLGFDLADFKFSTKSFNCKDCDNYCEIVQVMRDGDVISSMNSRCDKW